MPPYQFSTDWLVGREGDVWTKLFYINRFKFDSSISRSSYHRIDGIPAISHIIEVTKLRVILLTRQQSLLILPDRVIIPNILNAFKVDDHLLIYLTTNYEMRIATINDLNLDDSKLISEGVKNIHPMRISNYSIYNNTIDSILIEYLIGVRVITYHNGNIESIYYNESLVDLISVHFDCIVMRDCMIRFNRVSDNKVNTEGYTYPIIELDDAYYLDSITSTSLICLSNGRILDKNGKILVDRVDRLVKFLHSRRGCMMIGTDENIYHIMLGSSRITHRIMKLDISITLV